MKFLTAIALTLFCAACSPANEDIPDTPSQAGAALTAKTVLGDWSGQLDVPGGPSLWLVFHVTGADEGGLAITMDSPDQGAMGIPGEVAVVENGSFSADFPMIGARFTMTPGASEEMDGVWMQGMPMTFKLKRGNHVPERVRPQEPETRAYVIEEVRFAGGAEGIELAGELTMPEGEGPFPGIVLISGSGPQDRNEELMTHKPFLVLSDHLTRNGYAVLRYDDRGFGESSGDFSVATTEDFAADAAAALAFLKSDERVAAMHAAYIGHSEGGLAAPIAARTESASALVLLAGPAVPLSDVILQQTAEILRAEGGSDADAVTAVEASRKAFDIIRQGAADEAELLSNLKRSFTDSGMAPSMAETIAERMTGPWMVWAMDYDPLPALKAFGGPVLALFGERDTQVAAAVSAPLMKKALSHPLSEVSTLEGLNHLFQPAGTGAPSEYVRIETTFDPAALQAVSDWLDEVFDE